MREFAETVLAYIAAFAATLLFVAAMAWLLEGGRIPL